MFKLRKGQRVEVTAQLNGGYEEGSAQWELSDTVNFSLQVLNALVVMVICLTAQGNPTTTLTLRVDADQDTGEGQVSEIIGVATIIGLEPDATAIDLRFGDAEPVPTENEADEGDGLIPPEDQMPD